jgi:hypothetical protein
MLRDNNEEYWLMLNPNISYDYFSQAPPRELLIFIFMQMVSTFRSD